MHSEGSHVLAEAVADRVRVDWDSEEASAASAEARDVVRQLRVLATAAASSDGPRAGDTWAGLQLQEEIGRGTFGTVFRAIEPRLDRIVALKLLRVGSVATGKLAPRAVGEGMLLAKVKHPNVVTVFGADYSDGRFGIWMEYLEGRTLRELTATAGRLSADEAAIIGIDLCRALAAVHSAGFVHGDIKAQNVMRENGGRLVLMDFGAGGLLALEADDHRLIGTPAYIAPELLEGGRPNVKSDIYALGVLLFFLVAEEFPIRAQSIDQLRAAHAEGRRRFLRDARADLPDWFISAVDLALSFRPTDRPASAGEFESRLRSAMGLSSQRPRSRWPMLVAAGAIVAAAAISPVVWSRLSDGPEMPNGKVALAAFSGDADVSGAERVAAHVSQEIAAHLSAYGDLHVLAAPASAEHSVVSGRVVSDGSGFKVEARLTAPSGTELWVDSFTTSTEPQSAGTQASRAIAVALHGRLSPAEWNRILRDADGDATAALLFVRGRSHLSIRRADEMQRGLSFFMQAVTRRSSFALAQAGVAEAFTLLGVYRVMPGPASLDRAAAAADLAIAADPNLPEAHAVLGYVRKLQFDFVRAEASLRKAIELKPDLTDARVRLSTVYLQLRSFGDAVSEMKAALALEPKSIQVLSQYNVTLLLSRRYDEAIQESRAFVAAHPDLPGGYQTLGAALCYRGDYDEAIVVLRKGIALEGSGASEQYLKATLGIAEARSGRIASARRILKELEAQVQVGSGGTASDVAAVAAALGDRDKAIAWLRRAFGASEAEVGYLAINPRWDPLRGLPEFEELVKSVRPIR